MEERCLFKKWFWSNKNKTMNLNLNFTPYLKINSKKMDNVNCKPQNLYQKKERKGEKSPKSRARQSY